jgi:glycosyltransferase involved in cell wall biosynthesis
VSRVGLSVVVPMFNEAATLRELVARCRAAAAASDRDFEIVLVDDGSTDDTPRLLAELCDGERVRSLRPPHNVGQFRATQLGLTAARGELVCVLDADLQDPPELLADLAARLRAAPPSTRAVFAIKQRRDDPQPFLAAQAVFHWLQAVLSVSPIPRGASSCGVMRRDAAALVAAADTDRGNLGAVLAAARIRIAGLPFSRGPRRDGGSRLGGLGHLSEAVASLAMTGALARLSLIGAAGALLGVVLQRDAWRVSGIALLVVATAFLVGAALAHAFRRRVLASLARRRAPV